MPIVSCGARYISKEICYRAGCQSKNRNLKLKESMTGNEFKVLYDKEIASLINEVFAYQDDDQMWAVVPGTINSGGHLVQHLTGNLKTYICLELGDVAYIRDRDAEFSKRLFTRDTLLAELDVLRGTLNSVFLNLTEEDLQKEYPQEVLAMFPQQSVSIILTHLLIHLGYHRGQLNYHRRFMQSTD